jgi:hypothetical protein
VIGGYAQLGVPTGVGSGAVLPVGGYANIVKIGGPGAMGAARNLFLLPSSPLKTLAPKAQIEFDPGQSAAEVVCWRSAPTRSFPSGFASRVRASISPICLRRGGRTP